MSRHYQYDVLVIGSGAAGLTLALNLPPSLRVAVLSKGELANGSTYWAQGGVAAVLDNTDTIESHVADTLVAGGGLCKEEAVRFTVEHSREAIQRLICWQKANTSRPFFCPEILAALHSLRIDFW